MLHGAPGCALGNGQVHRLEAKDALLLAWLALEGPTPRARLAALLWPEADAARARAALRQRLARLKQSLGFDAVTRDDLAALAMRVADEASIGDDPFLDGIDLDADTELGAWLAARRRGRRGDRVEALAARASAAEANGELAAALRDAQALVELDPTSEHAHRRVMRLHYLRGDAGAALAAFARCKAALRESLGVAPSFETEQLARQVDAASATTPQVARSPTPVTLLRTPRLIGRQRELAGLREAWHGGRAVLLMGEAGMGKSRLLETLADERRRGPSGSGRIAAAQARPGDAAIPYATLARLLRRVRELAPVTLPPARNRALARILPELDEAVPAISVGLRSILQDATAALLAEAAMEALVLDDLHLADPASLELVEGIVGSAGAGGPAWAFGQRSGDDTAQAAALRGSLENAGLLAVVPLGPLDEREMASLVDSLGIEGLIGNEVGALLMRRTGGNPMFALEVLKQGLSSGRFDERRARAPIQVGALIERRLLRLSERALALARVAAIAGVDFDIGVAERVMATPALALADAWAELEASQVLRGSDFAHDLVYEAVLRTLPAPIARHLHGACAEVLAALGSEPARLAAHWLEAGRDDAAAEALMEAAVRTRRTGRFGEAGRFELMAADALARIGNDELSFDRRFQAANDLSNSAPIDEFEPIAAALTTAARTEHQRGRAALAMAHVNLSLGAFSEAAKVVAAGLASARAAGDRSTEGELLFGEGYLDNWHGRFQQSLQHMELAIRAMEEVGREDRAAEMRRSAGVLLAKLGRPREAGRMLEPAARQLVAAQIHDTAALAYGQLARAHLQAGEPERAESARRLAVAAAEHVGAEFNVTQHFVLVEDRFSIAQDAGDLVATARLWDELRGELEASRSVHGVPMQLHGAWLMLELGRHDLVRHALARADALLEGRRRTFDLFTLIELRAGIRSAATFFGDDAPAALASIGAVPGRALLLAHQADAIPPSIARALLRAAIEQAERDGMLGFVAGLRSAEAQLERVEGRLDAAADNARLALEAMRSHGSVVARPLVWLRCGHALTDADDAAGAAVCLADGARWIEATAAALPDAYRSAFVSRQPTNRELLALAARSRR